MICKECGKILTDKEEHYYEYRCESCEREWFDSMDRWMRGEKNEEFDIIYGGNNVHITTH